MDFHTWVEINGKLVDWNTHSKVLSIQYDMIALTRLKTKEYEMVYREWEFIECNIQKFIDACIDDCKKRIDSLGTKVAWKIVKDAPNCCIQRALLLKINNPTARIVFGSAGMKSKNGKIWWEFGNGRKSSKNRPNHVL